MTIGEGVAKLWCIALERRSVAETPAEVTGARRKTERFPRQPSCVSADAERRSGRRSQASRGGAKGPRDHARGRCAGEETQRDGARRPRAGTRRPVPVLGDRAQMRDNRAQAHRGRAPARRDRAQVREDRAQPYDDRCQRSATARRRATTVR